MHVAPEAFPTPRGISVERVGPNQITIVRRWRYGMFNIAVFIVWISLGGASLAVPFVDHPSAELVDQLAHMAAIAALMLPIGYLPIALVANHTLLSVIGTDVHIRHGPLPWPGKSTATIAGATQFGIRKPPVGALERANSTRRAIMGLTTEGQWFPVWEYNLRLVPQSHAVAVCRILERCAHQQR